MATETWTKGNNKQYIRDGAIIGYVGPQFDISEITLANGWVASAYVPFNGDVAPADASCTKYAAMRAAGVDEVTARALSGCVG